MEQRETIDGYQKLAVAITIQAVEDFRKAVKHLARGKGNLDLDICEIKEVISFVKSAWFTTLTSVHPEIILDKLQEEIDQSGINKILTSDKYNNLLAQFDVEEVDV